MNLFRATVELKLILFSIFLFILSCKENETFKKDFVFYELNPEKEKVEFFWKDDSGKILKNFENLKSFVESRNHNLIFAMNGGMFEVDHTPKGLYIENYKALKDIDTLSGSGNFYLNPNGIFYLTNNRKAYITKTRNFKKSKEIKFATQSGPLLLINGKINIIFQKESKNINIRNGVGMKKNGEVVFAMSKKKISFYNFAKFFQDSGCTEALYLDSFVSRTYYPSKKITSKDENFGVMIAVIK